MSKASWQKPFVDVFKRFKTFESSRTAKKGAVSTTQDNSIGRKVFKVSGAVSASNYLSIPDPEAGIKSLGLVGNNVYLEFLPQKNRLFNIHLDFQIQGYEPIVRFTVSNMFDAYNKTSGNVLQIPFPKNAPEKWTVMVLDVAYHLENFGIFDKSSITHFTGIHQLKNVQICSQTLFRGLYTSDNVYKISTLPKDMNFKIPPKGETWSSVYQLVYYPEAIDPDFMDDMEKQGPPPMEEIQKQMKDTIDPVLASSISEMKKLIQKPALSQEDFAAQDPALRQSNAFSQQQQEQQQQLTESVIENQSPLKFGASSNPQQVDDFIKKSFYQSGQKQQAKAVLDGLQPYPITQLSHTIGFSGRYCPDIKWSRTQESPNELIYASGSVLVSAEVGSNNQRFFLGHTAPISCMDLTRDGKYIATAQEGKQSLVKIWDYCEGLNICSFQAPYENLKCISFSYNNKLLCTVGTDNHNREIIIIWNIDGIENKKRPEILAKQVSDFNIITMKFSPIELDKLVSCGKENIRFWRIKNGHLPAQTVVLNHHARNTVFTVLDFEFSYQEPCAARQSGEVKRVFIGSKSGMLYQVDYYTKQLEGVFKCHEGAITSIALSAGFCVTGSEDQFLRVWPLDFSEFLIVAKHEGVIHSLDVSQDALQVACGTSTGGLGVLDLSNHNYKTFLRSHTDEITDMVYHQFSNYLITLSSDLSIRIWDLEKYEQVYEFSYPAEDYCTTIVANPASMTFAAGFASGTFRIFDIEKTCIVEECRYHEGSISCLTYSQDGKHLFVGDSDSFYSAYDVERQYQPIKSFECEMESEYQSIAVSNNNQLIASIGDSGTHINIFDAQSFSLALKMFCPNTTIKKLMFAENNMELFVITAESKIKVFAIQLTSEGAEAYFLREVNCTHRDGCSDICYTENFKYLVTVGGDSLLKIWDYDLSLKGPGSNQIFLAHIGKINKCLFLPGSKRLLTVGGFEGIYEWEFNGDLTPQERDIDLQGLTPQHNRIQQKKTKKNNNASLTHSKLSQDLRMDFSDQEDEQQMHQQQQLNVQQQLQSQRPPFDIRGSEIQGIPQQQQPQISQLQQGNDEFQLTDSEVDEKQDKYDVNALEQSGSKRAQDILSNMSMQFTKQQQKSKFAPVQVAQDFEPHVIDYKKQTRKKDRHRRKVAYTANETRQKHNLPFKQYYQEKLSEQVQNKINRIRDNPDNFNLDYIIGYNNDSHENIVWNYMKGWFAYAVENVLIIESLDKERKQKVVQLPDIISCIVMSKDFKYVVVGSASKNEKDIANIYSVETTKWQIVNKYAFHTRGVQSLQFNENGKYLVSIGNFKECTVCVWEFSSAKLLASSYTMDKINDLKISSKCFSYDRNFEFVTVGRDQVQFWAFTKEQKLEYYDVFIEKRPDEEKYPEATSVDYISNQDNFYALVGLSNGELVMIEYGNFKQTYRNQVCQGEIVNIYGNSIINRVILTSMDGYLYYWDTDKFSQDFIPSFIKLSFPSCPISISLEPTFNEGIAGCLNGGIFYFNLGNQYQSMLVSTIDSAKQYRTQMLDGELAYTAHEDGKLRIWNVKTAEEVFGYNFKSPVTATFYNPGQQKLTCFFRNNNEVKILNMAKFQVSETYQENSYTDAEKKAHIYPVKAFEAILGGKQSRFILLNNGSLYTMDALIVQKKTIQRAQKILELHEVQDIQYYNEKSIIVVSDKNGRIQTFIVDYNDERQIPYGFTSIDDYDIYENPHGSAIDQNKEEQSLTTQLYKDAQAETKLVISRQNQGCYYAINSTLQYLFVRNYQKRQVMQRFVLHDFPSQISLYENKGTHYAHVALQDGTIEQVNVEDKEDRQIFAGMLDGPITDIVSRKAKNCIIISTQTGTCIYKLSANDN